MEIMATHYNVLDSEVTRIVRSSFGETIKYSCDLQYF